MIRFRTEDGDGRETIARHAGGTLALLAMMLWAPSAHAYPSYDNGAGIGCVSCHTGFVRAAPARCTSSTGPSSASRPATSATRAAAAPRRCCTYWSGPGGGYGCAGCHGQDYGETSPNSGQPKATSYGLRQFHVSQGVTTCGPSGCHQPGALGASESVPAALRRERRAAVLRTRCSASLTDPCSSPQEDLPFDRRQRRPRQRRRRRRRLPGRQRLPGAAPPRRRTPTPGVACGTAPAMRLHRSGARAACSSTRRSAGKEKLKVTLTKLQPAVTQGQFGDPVSGTTAYAVCVYDAANQLRGEYSRRPRGRHVRRQAVLEGDVRQGLQVQRQGHHGGRHRAR